MLDLRRLRLLRELQRLGTVSAVADALSYSPSTVSQQLRVLEREAGTALFEPAGRRVRLTDAARQPPQRRPAAGRAHHDGEHERGEREAHEQRGGHGRAGVGREAAEDAERGEPGGGRQTQEGTTHGRHRAPRMHREQLKFPHVTMR